MEFKFCLHSQISNKELKDIIDLKNIHWQYSFNQHLHWIEKNIFDDDIHVLMSENQILLGYLNLVKIKTIINGRNFDFYGIGNVCSKKNGLGYGRELLIATREYLLKNNYKGILFCKDELINFYEKFGYILICKNKIVSDKYKNTNIMVFNVNFFVDSLEYDGRVF